MSSADQHKLKALKAIELLAGMQASDAALAAARARANLDSLEDQQKRVQQRAALLVEQHAKVAGGVEGHALQLSAMSTLSRQYLATARELSQLQPQLTEAHRLYDHALDSWAQSHHRQEHLIHARQAEQAHVQWATEQRMTSEMMSSFLAYRMVTVSEDEEATDV